MKVLVILFLSVLNTALLQAQDSTVLLSARMFTPSQRINLATLEGWRYKSGYNPDWAKPGVQTKGWQKLKPADLSTREVNANGRTAGWFRINIKLDSTFNGIPLVFVKGGWAAIDLYVDGRLLASYGNTGRSGKPYEEDRPFLIQPTQIQLPPKQEHLIALYVVDEVSPFTSNELKSAFRGANSQTLGLAGPQFIQSTAVNATLLPIFSTLWLVVPLLLTMLFGLLSFLTIYEKSLIRVLTLWAIFLTLANLTYFIHLFPFPFTAYLVLFNVGNTLLYGSIPLLVLALIQILHYSTVQLSRFLVSMMIIAIGINYLLENSWAIQVGIILQALIFMYVLIVSWRTLKGAQWPIVIGALMTFLFFILFFLINLNSPNLFSFYLISTGMILSLPISLLVYIFLRFKEIIAEVGEKATAVLQITEEKRELLATQNERLEQQVEVRTTELNQSLRNLKATQNQLIQKEKLASLGELTAGIAHEIQNPLNFVNNFSEVSTELIDELKEGPLQKLPDSEKDYADEILGDLTSNLQKINHHGGRASSIVKGMLEHARTESGEKRPTDLNALADEYLKIAYHGLRAKDKSFNCELVTEFDPTLKPAEVAPQEIGRVLLNLFNNAFYAVSERARQTKDAEYKPMVKVRIQQQVDNVVIQVQDNGTGIPEAVKAKIFQPFFTTKPTGEGTGLGLSLSYDIITKGYGGKLTVSSQKDQGSQFVIDIPIS